MLSLTVSIVAVRTKAGLSDSTYDSAITALIAEQVPALESVLVPVTAPETDLGATEIVTAELLDQIGRAEGGVEIGGVRTEVVESTALRAQGLARLAPYRLDLGTVRAAGPR